MTAPKIFEVSRPVKGAMGGGLDGAERTARETALWSPSMRSPDQIINSAKPLADARGRDMVQNDGYTTGAVALHRDNIVGSQYRLNSQPNWRAIGQSAEWAEEFQIAWEARFHTIAESEECWLDAQGRLTFTGLIRLGIAGFVMTGEVINVAEWIKDSRRPCSTAVLAVSPARLSNPNGMADNKYLRGGVRKDARGRPVAYCFREGHPGENYDMGSYSWKEIAASKPWGRRQVIHIIDQLLPDQSRGIADMVAVLKQMRMTKKFQEVVLQNAVINASYAAAIESDLPDADVFAALGAGVGVGNPVINGMDEYLRFYMQSMGQYLSASKSIMLDGAKIPHLFPGSKLNLKPVGTPGGVGTDYEQSLLRHTAAALGLSYEQFSRDYTKTNYSSARASMNETHKNMQAKKKAIADRQATGIATLVLEEEIARGNLPLPPGKTRDWFYEPLVKDALTQCAWIGASRGQIDEMKETQAAILRIKSGLSTYAVECARLGYDFRDLFEQAAREKRLMVALGIDFTMETQRENSAGGKGGSKAKPDDDENTDDEDNNDE